MIRLQGNDPALQALFQRPGYPPEIERSVAEILENVRTRGDQALSEYALTFDKAELTPDQFRVTDEEIAAAGKKVSSTARKALKEALKAIQSFARKQKPRDYRYAARRGVMLGEQFSPMERVGVYIPGGTAPLVSTVIHTAGIASAAGVKEIVAVTPPGTHPAVLYAMRLAGVTEIYRLGGVYGIAALAFGTESIQPVEKIVGPGNAYVTAAKKLVFGKVAIDMVAGPSEIMVIADRTAPPEFIAADFLSQAEHGSGLEQSVLVTDSDEVIDAVEAGIKRAGAVTKMLENGMTPEEILTEVCGDLGVLFFENEPVSYKCYCNRHRVEAALISIGREELGEIMAEGKPFPVECQFCDEVYRFTPEDIAELLKKI